VARGSNDTVNGVNAIEGGGEVKRGIKEEGSDGGVVKARAASEVELGRPEMRDDRWGPPVSRARREGEGSAAGGASP
jgi:hypothetical protein